MTYGCGLKALAEDVKAPPGLLTREDGFSKPLVEAIV